MKPVIDLLVVGAGFSGAVCARELAETGLKVLVVDRRDHIGGNAHDRYDTYGVLIHDYGPHIFHTQSARIFEYLSQFTAWRPYELRVLATVGDKLIPLPLNRTSLNVLYGLNLDEAGAAEFLARAREPLEIVRNSEDVVLSAVGRDLCDKVYRGYTQKMWGMDLRDLAPSVASRIPVRTNDDDRYFTDPHQGVPSEGYTKLFENLLDHPGISVELRTPYERVIQTVRPRHTVYTGPLDEYFGYRLGRLPYRTLRILFEHHLAVHQVQPAASITYPGLNFAFTRTTEYKQITGQIHTGTTISREFPEADGDPYYPIPNPAAQAQYQAYKECGNKERATTFVGRLAEYRYYNMDQAVAAALKAAEKVGKILNG